MQYAMKVFFLGTAIMMVLDAMYLSVHRRAWTNTIINIQKTALQVRWESVVACYVLLATGLWYFILKERRSPLEAFLLGVFVYGVYDTTTYATLKHYPLWMAAMDTAWGGTLFGLTTWTAYAVLGKIVPI